MDHNSGKPPIGTDPQVHYPQLHQDDMQGASAPPPPYAPIMAPPVQQTVVVVTDGAFGPYPKIMRCPNCQNDITSSTRAEAGPLTWALCCLLCCVGCDLGCCLIPFCIDGAQDIMHDCPNCKTFLGAYQRMKC